MPGLGCAPASPGFEVTWCWVIAGFALAYSNRFAGQLSDISVRRGMGNVGCFYGGGGAAAAAALLIILFWRFGSLGQDPQAVAKQKAA